MNGNQTIPFLDLVTPHLRLEQELVRVFREALRSADFIGGPSVEAFEQDFAAYCGTRHCVAVASGTDALRFALMATDIGPGDTVITVPNTFFATVEAILQAGARPRFVDVDEHTYTMDANKLQEHLERDCRYDAASGRLEVLGTGTRLAAIVPVHLYGQMADMDGILELARRYKLLVVEDACQAHGAEYFSTSEGRWRRAGTVGHAAAFSFYPGKNLGACGDAGAVTTSNELIARKVRMLRDHGQVRKYYHDLVGYNGRLDAIQAGLLRCKLAYLAKWNTARRERAATYNRVLAPLADQVVLPYEPAWSRAVYHLYVIRTGNRDLLRSSLSGAGISTGIHYPVPVHLQDACATLNYSKGHFPVTERLADEIISLPMFPQLTEEQQNRVAEAIAVSLSAAVAKAGSAA